MKFSSKIERERHEPWAAHYLNYALLKKKQHDIEEVQDKPGHEHVFEARKHIFQVCLPADPCWPLWPKYPQPLISLQTCQI